jgi:hypothetical protein
VLDFLREGNVLTVNHSHCRRRYRPHRWLPSAEALPRSRWRNWILAWTRTMRTVRTVARQRFLARNGSGLVVMLIVRVRARPSRPKPGRPITHHLCKGAQKVRGGSRPHRPHLRHRGHSGGIESASITSSTTSSLLPQ